RPAGEGGGGDVEPPAGPAGAGGVRPETEHEAVGGGIRHEPNRHVAGHDALRRIDGEMGGVAGPVRPRLGGAAGDVGAGPGRRRIPAFIWDTRPSKKNAGPWDR